MTTEDLKPTERFSDRAEDYVKFRPSYPKAVIDFLQGELSLKAGIRVADIGSGTGIFTRLLLAIGAKVFAVEANDAMRKVAEGSLGSLLGFNSVRGTAEETGLGVGGHRVLEVVLFLGE